jgi:photosystem II stability/assembly factor-like uncharacterized protein
LTLSDIYPLGQLGFGQEASTQIERAVIDVVYGTTNTCRCEDATQYIYAITDTSGAGSPGLPAEVLYSTDGGSTWTEVNVDGMGAEESPLAIDLVGQYLVVLGDDAHFYAEINQETGEPGTFTEVTTGYVGAGSPQDLHVVSPREIFIVGDGGYVYKSTDITASVTVVDAGDATSEDLKRIHGSEGRKVSW